MHVKRSWVLLGTLALANCKSTTDSSSTRDILGQEDAAPIVPTPDPLLTQKLRAIYTESGFAGPLVSIFDADDAGAVHQGRALARSSVCAVDGQAVSCKGARWSLVIAKSHKSAKWTHDQAAGEKRLKCKKFAAPGMSPSSGLDCTESASHEADLETPPVTSPQSVQRYGVDCRINLSPSACLNRGFGFVVIRGPGSSIKLLDRWSGGPPEMTLPFTGDLECIPGLADGGWDAGNIRAGYLEERDVLRISGLDFGGDHVRFDLKAPFTPGDYAAGAYEDIRGDMGASCRVKRLP